MLGEASQSTAIGRLFLGAELLDPFGLIEQDGDQADEREPQQLEQPHRAADSRCAARRRKQKPAVTSTTTIETASDQGVPQECERAGRRS